MIRRTFCKLLGFAPALPMITAPSTGWRVTSDNTTGLPAIGQQWMTANEVRRCSELQLRMPSELQFVSVWETPGVHAIAYRDGLPVRYAVQASAGRDGYVLVRDAKTTAICELPGHIRISTDMTPAWDGATPYHKELKLWVGVRSGVVHYWRDDELTIKL